jgi:hypothetical protein
VMCISVVEQPDQDARVEDQRSHSSRRRSRPNSTSEPAAREAYAPLDGTMDARWT